MAGSTHGWEYTVLGTVKAQKDKRMPDLWTETLKDNTRDNDEYQQTDRLQGKLLPQESIS